MHTDLRKRWRGLPLLAPSRLIAALCVIMLPMATLGRELLGEERRAAIVRLLAADGRVRASDVARRLGISLDTVRRDLQDLADIGALRRVHGGALPPSPSGPTDFSARLTDDVTGKVAIAAAAAGLLVAGELIALGGGTTMLEFARQLPRDLEATVIVTSPQIASELSDHARLIVDMVGGRLHRETRSVVGVEAVDTLRTVRADVCILAGCSLHPSVGITLRHREEAEVVRAMVEGAGRVVALTTAAKLGSVAAYPVASIERIDTLVTDASEVAVAEYRTLGIEVVRT
jgi:DeoR/GlpR family transcriptional regulator of sugar metabolism